tara:strand:- start:780 stop:1028 length:249 start_codon:yes stop_codon:yes gene_type:complete
MNFFQLIAAYIKQNLNKLKETEDPNERKKQWIQIAFGSVLALGYGAIHLPADVSLRDIIFAVFLLFIIIYFSIRALRYFKII